MCPSKWPHMPVCQAVC
ncbi:hypothetical protein F383_34487 [Gossypium arboreum]|uniref:Uncharacterized protein n=1 Tax=Gossypium arboreum TaxID=29729 RepID=A0A0B0N4M7_GOSAR|nr:hypothetical protein F383_34487 [Gossypium arboreum]